MMWVDLLAGDAVCPYGHRWTLAALNAWRAAHPGRQVRQSHVPAPLRTWYAAQVPCPACGSRLQWRVDEGEGFCRCGAVWTVDQLVDRAARRVMEEEPRGARPYHKPRRGH
jgi:transposase